MKKRTSQNAAPSLRDLPHAGRPEVLPGRDSARSEPRQSDLLFNRDLSWLKFNDRVLDEAADPTVPALERLRFATIVSSNLDEFFMVRVAKIAAQARRHPNGRSPDGLTAAQLFAQIREHVIEQKERQGLVLENILASLRHHGIDVQAEFERNARLDREILGRKPPLDFIFRRPTDPLPPLQSERIHVFFRFAAGYAIATLKDRDGRLLELSPRRGKRRFVLLERWLAARAAGLFPDRKVIEAFPFKIIREADIRYRPDDDESIEDQIIEGIEKRGKAKVIRLEVDSTEYSEGALFLATALGLGSAALYRFPLPLDLRTLALVYRVPAPAKLKYAPVNPAMPRILRKSKNLFKTMRERDILLHHPYDSFDAVVRFLEEASRDPHVTQIYHTMYRTSSESPVMEALKNAVRRGKKVMVYVELKARFDELNNVRWAQELSRAGVKVVRPLGSFKVHSKLTLVVRREAEGPQFYLHLGTGNYHPGTATQYTDLGLLTSDFALGRDALSYFVMLARGKRAAPFKEFLVAPSNLQDRVVELIEDEVRIQKSGGKGRIIAKMNALVDPRIIQSLYGASRAGVRVDLLVRGSCCLVPELEGISENIRVRSVVDRYLEHSRIYYFRAGGARKIYLSSADWMPRNFYTRYEVAFPVKNPAIKRFIRDVILKNSFEDNVKGRELKSDGNYRRLSPPPGGRAVRSQFLFEELARRQYKGTLLDRV